MSNLLVTGRWGQTHVTSAQARNFHAGLAGPGQYVMGGLTATMTTANTCHIAPGVACFNGADVEVPAGGEDVTIDNGTQGMMRHDLVVLRYVLDASEQTEDVSLTVVKGTPAASDPQDPAYNSGSILDGTSPCDMPLWRIPLDGVAVGEPEPMYSVLTPAAGLMESAAQAASDIDDLRDSLSQKAFSVETEPVYEGDIYGASFGQFHLITGVGHINQDIGTYSEAKIGSVPFRLAHKVDDVGMTNSGDSISIQVATDGSVYARTFNLALTNPIPVRFAVAFIA